MALDREMAEIFYQLKQPYEHLTDNGKIRDLINDTQTKIDEAHEQINQLQQDLFARYGVSQWEEKEEDLKLLMDQFTCFVERKAMTNMTGSEAQDIGVECGDIVLF